MINNKKARYILAFLRLYFRLCSGVFAQKIFYENHIIHVVEYLLKKFFMKIALVTKNLIPIAGGSERYARQFAFTLAQLGHEIHVFCDHLEGILPDQIHHHPTHKFTANIYQLAKQKYACDVVFAITPCMPTDVYRAGDGVHRHWLNLKYPNPIIRGFARCLPGKIRQLHCEKCLYQSTKNCRLIIANSHLVKTHIEQYYPQACGRIHVVHNGVDLEQFTPQENNIANRKAILAQYCIPTESTTLLFVANNWQRKGLDTLLSSATPLLRERLANIVVIGKGKIAYWKKIAIEKKIESSVFFVGQSQDMSSWYRASDLLVLPTHYDPFANVCLEAMACGTPVVTTRDNGASEIITHGENGAILSDLHQINELQKILVQFVQEKLYSMWRKNAIVTAGNLSMLENAQKTLQILKQAAGG